MVEVDQFPPASAALDKDSAGEHEEYFDSFPVLIYINPALDVNASPVVLIFNILETLE